MKCGGGGGGGDGRSGNEYSAKEKAVYEKGCERAL